MKISKENLSKMIEEAVTDKLKEHYRGGEDAWGINWKEMAWQDAQGGRLSPKWEVIMRARMATSGDMDKALQVLKAAVATLEIHKGRAPQAPAPEEPAPSLEDMLDFQKLNTGG